MSYRSAGDLFAEIEELRDEVTEECPKCDGDGEINLGLLHPDDVETKTCPQCDGDGEIEDEITRSQLDELEEAYEEITGYSGDGDSATLIAEDEFVDHARELADDIHGISDLEWPFSHIDWDAAADDLRMDYSEIEIAGIYYLYR